MESIPVLTIEDVANIDNVLQEYLQKSESELAVIIDKGAMSSRSAATSR